MLGSGKISGHSGTAQKHRSAFKDARSLQKKKARVAGGEIQDTSGRKQRWEARNAPPGKSKSIQFLVMVILIGVLCLLSDAFWGYYNSGFYTYQAELTQQEIAQENRQTAEAYRLLVNSGEDYLRANSFAAAQEEFSLALKLYPHGEKALAGMTKTLVGKCLYLETDCQMAKEYQRYMELLKE